MSYGSDLNTDNAVSRGRDSTLCRHLLLKIQSGGAATGRDADMYYVCGVWVRAQLNKPCNALLHFISECASGILQVFRYGVYFLTVFEIKGAPCTRCAHFGGRVHRFWDLFENFQYSYIEMST